MNRKVAFVGRLVELFEASAYGLAMIFGLIWLVRRMRGAPDPPDEGERAGLWVLAGIALLLIAWGCRTVLRQRRRAEAAE
jgi:hypothetical protein